MCKINPETKELSVGIATANVAIFCNHIRKSIVRFCLITLLSTLVISLFFSSGISAGEWEVLLDGSSASGEPLEPEQKDVSTPDILQLIDNYGILSPISPPRKPLNIVFVKGYDAYSMLTNTDFKNEIKDMFKGHNVQFKFFDKAGEKQGTKKEIIESFEGADIYLFNGHGCATSYYGMQCLQVAPSDDNTDKKDDISVLTSLDLKKALVGKKKPKLVVFNICYGIDERIPYKNRFSTVFVNDGTIQGNAFIGWMGKSRTNIMDEKIKNLIFAKWVKRDETGSYPQLEDVFQTKSDLLHPIIKGDRKIRFLDEYFVLFQFTLPKVKEEKVIKKRPGESKKEWSKRRKDHYEKLNYHDFTFEKKPLSEHHLIAKIVADGEIYYPEEFFAEKNKYAIKISGSAASADDTAISAKGLTILLNRIGSYQTLEDLIAANPSIREKKDNNKIQILTFDDGENGFSNNLGEKEIKREFTIGPITQDWSQNDKEKAVELAKTAMMLSDLKCFVADGVYQGSAEKQLAIMRKFRDQILKSTPSGQHLIEMYYAYSPEYANKLRNNPQLIPVARFFFDRLSGWLEKIDLDTPEARSHFEPLIQSIAEVADIFFKQNETKKIEQIAAL